MGIKIKNCNKFGRGFIRKLQQKFSRLGFDNIPKTKTILAASNQDSLQRYFAWFTFALGLIITLLYCPRPDLKEGMKKGLYGPVSGAGVDY
uniref:Uncharacterized protein n=1 Tax=Pyxicephalus adspersus TaxID=30357 RepID=A0AAV3AB05_PYXAD|nr:TPA: hypothetical protein GDO54_013218 [Pyxicephalus adspersus]